MPKEQPLKETHRRERKDVDVIRRATMAYLYDLGLTQREIADAFGISQERVGRILAKSHCTEAKPWHLWGRWKFSR